MSSIDYSFTIVRDKKQILMDIFHGNIIEKLDLPRSNINPTWNQ